MYLRAFLRCNVGKDFKKTGSDTDTSTYPTVKTAEAALGRNDLFVLKDGGKAARLHRIAHGYKCDKYKSQVAVSKTWI